MEYNMMLGKDAVIEHATFAKNGVSEMHLMVKPRNKAGFDVQLANVQAGLEEFMAVSGLPKSAVVLHRYFVSDYANQKGLYHKLKQYTDDAYNGCAVSIVQQPPLEGHKAVLWAYVIYDQAQQVGKQQVTNNELVVQRGNYHHYWASHLTAADCEHDSATQTAAIFSEYNRTLAQKEISLKENCIRTWLFVKDVDYNYQGVVEARKQLFDQLNMTEQTNYISSTGIEGRHENPKVNVLMDAYSIRGIQQEQIRFLEALDYLNPTHEYGVTFERGTSVDYGDRRHIFISGTASIDNKGQVVHKRDINKQIGRTLVNIAQLLHNADAQMDDVAQMIVYLRDIADTQTVTDYFARHYTHIPKVIVLAPVCRPEWLIEIECIAIKDLSTQRFSNF